MWERKRFSSLIEIRRHKECSLYCSSSFCFWTQKWGMWRLELQQPFWNCEVMSLPTSPPQSLALLMLQSLWASLLESIAMLMISPSLKCLPCFLPLLRLPSLLPFSYIFSVYIYLLSIPSSFTCNLTSDFITSKKHLTIRSPLPSWLANTINTFQFLFSFIQKKLKCKPHWTTLLETVYWWAVFSSFYTKIYYLNQNILYPWNNFMCTQDLNDCPSADTF